MSGALSERVFVHKLKRVGFVDVEVVERHPYGLDQASAIQLFTPDLVQLMRELIPPERHHQIAVSVTVTADKP